MNDLTPHRLRGSLIERAAEIYAFTPFVPADVKPEPQPQAQPQPQPEPQPQAQPQPQPEPQPWPQPPVADVAPVETPVQLVQPSVPAPLVPSLFVPAVFETEGPAPTPFAPDDVPPPPPTWALEVNRGRLAELGMLVPGAPVGALAEEFRLVKRQLLQTARALTTEGKPSGSLILVCSARPGEGKTFCAVNLALSLAAESDVEVVLADADFIKPDVLPVLGIDNFGPGLLDAIVNPAIDIENCIAPTDVPQLSVLAAGTRSNSDTELLASGRAAAVLDRLATADPRRIVIFDSPPALAASPASVLAGLVGQTVLVVRADRTHESEVRDAVALLGACEHLQLLLNAVSFRPGGPRFGSYYGQEASS